MRASPPRSSEASETVEGLRAGLAVFARRPDDIERVVHSAGIRREVHELARWATGRRIPCVEAGEREMERLAGSTHHEGLIVACRPRRWASAREVAEVLVRARGTAVALERVRNPYNVGAILRSAAFFGVNAAILGSPAPDPGLPSLAVRVAEGGAENLLLARTTNLADTLARARALGVRIVGAEAAASASVFGFSWARPCILVVGHEREGLGDRVRAQCDSMISIPGSGSVESLNVSVAAGVLIAEMLARR